MDSDPFYHVLRDTQEELDQLSQHFANGTRIRDTNEFEELIGEVEETLQDLESSIVVLRREGSTNESELTSRNNLVTKLKKELTQLKQRWMASPNVSIDMVSVSNNDDAQSSSSDILQEQMLREQDTHLDNIHQTMQNLHMQATTMGQELQDQSVLLQDLEGGMDNILSKLSRGRRRLEWFYEQNSETYNNCCITMLIAVLLVLLVLAFVL